MARPQVETLGIAAAHEDLSAVYPLLHQVSGGYLRLFDTLEQAFGQRQLSRVVSRYDEVQARCLLHQ